MDAVKSGEFFFLQKQTDSLIGGQHKLLNQSVGKKTEFLYDFYRFSLGIHFHRYFRNVEVQSAVFVVVLYENMT